MSNEIHNQIMFNFLDVEISSHTWYRESTNEYVVEITVNRDGDFNGAFRYTGEDCDDAKYEAKLSFLDDLQELVNNYDNL